MATILVGTDEHGGSTIGIGSVSLQKFTASATGQLTNFRVWSGANGNMKISVYANSSNEPGALLSSDNVSHPIVQSQVNSLTIPSITITSGTVYWLGVAIDNAGGNCCGLSGTAGTRRWKGITFSSYSYPDPAGTGYNSDGFTGSIAGYHDLALSEDGEFFTIVMM